MSDNSEDREIVEAFAEEAAELLRAAETALNSMLSAAPDERAPLWNALLRGLHTVKGSAGFLGDGPLARRIEQRTHTTEDRAKAISEGRAPFNDAAIDGLAADVEAITTMVQALLTGEAVPDLPPPAPSGMIEVFAAPSPRGDPADDEANFASLFAGEPARPAAAPAPVAAPPVAAPPRAPAAPPAEAAPKAAEGAKRSSGADEMLRIKPERVDSLQSYFSEVLVGNLQSQALTADMVEFREQSAGLVSSWRLLQATLEDLGRHLPSHRRAELRGTLRGFGNQLKDNYKATYQLARRSHAVNAESRSALINLEDGIRALKLMPLEPFLQGFAATVRSAAREVDKKARLEVEARGAEIDRAVLTRLRDPLVHLVRNCIGHGVESPDERRRLGKDERGVVRLEARFEAQRVFLHVGDDGRGLDPAKVAAKAAAKGLIEPGRVLDEAGLLEVICMPGFSTQEQADKISGRGIGMDVVNDSIRSIGGTITLENKPGHGATFILEVPITTSTSQGMVVRLGKARMGLPYLNVQRVMRVEKDKRLTVEGRSVVHVQGDPLAVVRLSDILGVSGDAEVERHPRRPAVVLRHGSKRMVLEVDEIVGAVEMLIKPLAKSFAEHPLILGAAVGADSEILPVLDIPNMFIQVTQGSVTARSRASEAAEDEHNQNSTARRILIVDDSVTMRTLERGILEGAGYDVTMAEDGLKGMDALRSGKTFDLVVTDFNMPNMNGLEFCSSLRGHGFTTVPVLMVTTMDDDTTKKNVMNAGVDSYLVKRDFNQQTFLRAITELLGAA